MSRKYFARVVDEELSSNQTRPEVHKTDPVGVGKVFMSTTDNDHTLKDKTPYVYHGNRGNGKDNFVFRKKVYIHHDHLLDVQNDGLVILDKIRDVNVIPSFYTVCTDIHFPLSARKICALVSSNHLIYECINVDLGGKTYDVWVKEFASWAHTISRHRLTEASSESYSDSEEGNISDTDSIASCQEIKEPINATHVKPSSDESEHPFSIYKVINDLGKEENKAGLEEQMANRDTSLASAPSPGVPEANTILSDTAPNVAPLRDYPPLMFPLFLLVQLMSMLNLMTRLTQVPLLAHLNHLGSKLLLKRPRT
ncbi:hypothetical protein L1987_43237 [Smallanthus sonchifolius]|uniref:Uncharacterized protein n=1 Tax=Smallanthus sonchifolius TaxID=185202 RepID=A0ACB9GM51_9ASTR|nr:hypothetical protein L1987_43237 [Smallanthus sonchifolius]